MYCKCLRKYARFDHAKRRTIHMPNTNGRRIVIKTYHVVKTEKSTYKNEKYERQKKKAKGLSRFCSIVFYTSRLLYYVCI